MMSPAAKTPGMLVRWKRSTATHCLWSRTIPARSKSGPAGISRKMKTAETGDDLRPGRRSPRGRPPPGRSPRISLIFAVPADDDPFFLEGPDGRRVRRPPGFPGHPEDPAAHRLEGADVLQGLFGMPDRGDRRAPEQRPVAGGAVADALPDEPVLAGDQALLGHGLPRGQDDRAGLR